jgi:hypothetical protein
MAFRHPETSLHQIHQSRFLRRPDARLWVLKADLKYQLSDFIKFAWFNTQDAGNVFLWPFATLKHRFIDFNKLIFKTSVSDYEFLWPFAYLNHHLSDLVQSIFTMPRMHKKSSHFFP